MPKENKNDETWLDVEIQPAVMEAMIRQYNQFREIESHQIDHEIMNLTDYLSRIVALGLLKHQLLIDAKLKEIEDGKN